MPPNAGDVVPCIGVSNDIGVYSSDIRDKRFGLEPAILLRKRSVAVLCSGDEFSSTLTSSGL